MEKVQWNTQEASKECFDQLATPLGLFRIKNTFFLWNFLKNIFSKNKIKKITS